MRTSAPLVKLTIFAVVTVVLTGALAHTLGSLELAGGPSYRAHVSDVTGLLAGDDVRIAGVRVGRVRDVRLIQPDTGRPVAEVTFQVDGAVPLPANVHAAVRYRNLIGQRYLALAEGAGGDGPDGGVLEPGGLIPLHRTTPALDLTVLFNGFRPLFTGLSPEEVNAFAYEIIQVLQGERGTVADLLRRTASLTNTLADRDEVIGQVIDNLSRVLATLEERDQQLDRTLLSLQELVSGLAADRAAIGEAVAGIGELADATASLVGDARPSLAADIGLLNQLSATLNRNADVLDDTLRRLPVRIGALTRTGSTGSWFNFYLCDFDGQVRSGGHAADAGSFSSSAARCRTGGGS